MEIKINKNKVILCSQCRLLKSESFIKDAQNATDIDVYLLKACEGIYTQLNKVLSLNPKNDETYMLSDQDKRNSFYFKINLSGDTDIECFDIVFYAYISKESSKRQKTIFGRYLSQESFKINIEVVKENAEKKDFSKLYNIYLTEGASFPYLNKIQRDIVTTENKNMLIQGVAGSGKTNVCIDKIIFSACREYYGKTLYTTYSKSLLIDTEYKISAYKNTIKDFIEDLKDNLVEFVGPNKKTAVENRLGLWLDVDGEKEIIRKLEKIVEYLETKVDYYLIENIYAERTKEPPLVADEEVFTNEYIGNIKNYRLGSNLERLKTLSSEILYKEIYGMIFGCSGKSGNILTQEEYAKRRINSFTKGECDTIYSVAMDYAKFLNEKGYVDNNTMSRDLLKMGQSIQYSLAVVDEVQDLTQINLELIKTMSRKMFCVGDAMQMINPSYFSFAYLKRLMFDKELSDVSELKHNYRNSSLIEKILSELGKLNYAFFGNHSFVLKSTGADSSVRTTAARISDKTFLDRLSSREFDSLTIVVNTAKKKEELRKKFKKQEILTVSEIKGLERKAVLLVDLLSDNKSKWLEMSRRSLDRKNADENSVYRYYFNLFYVGLSRATQYVFIYESDKTPQFESFLDNNFDYIDTDKAIDLITDTVGIARIAEEETMDRIESFLRAGQYDNAIFAAQKLDDVEESQVQLNRINIYRNFIRKGDYRTAGIELWKLGLTQDAKKQFVLSGDEKLEKLVNEAVNKGIYSLDYNACDLIESAKDDAQSLIAIESALRDDLKKIREDLLIQKESIRRTNYGKRQ